MTNKLRTLLIIPPIIIGVLIFMFLTSSKTPPAKSENEDVTRVVRTIRVPVVDLKPYVDGYGVVTPAKVWTAVAQVSGRVVEMHPRLRDGEIIPEGTLLFRIDPIDYELALEQIKAELAELAVQERNTSDLLTIEQRNLELAQREAARLKKLVAKGSTSRSNADDAERSMLNSRTAVQNLKNTLALIPSQRRVIEARLAQAERDLANTQVYAPFNLRVAGLAMESDQFVSTGQKLFEGDSVDRSEVIAQVAISSLRHLFLGHGDKAPAPSQLSEGIAEFADIQSIIQLDMGGHNAQWQAEFVRFTDNIDNETRTIGAVVALDKPYEKIIPGRRPPLSKGMFVKVRLIGRKQSEQLVIPRSAVRNDKVMIMDDQQRLSIREVQTRFNQDDISVIASGLSEGQLLVVSDLVPAVTGMRLKSEIDEQLQQRVLNMAGAEQ